MNYLRKLSFALIAILAVLGCSDTLGAQTVLTAGVQVLFNGNPGTPRYVSATEINVIVPWETNGQTSANMVVSFSSIQSAPRNLSVQTQSPGLFAINAQGTGQVAATNQNGTYNGASGQGYAPGPQGSVISVYGTGGVQSSPPGTNGSVTPIPSAPRRPMPGPFRTMAAGSFSTPP